MKTFQGKSDFKDTTKLYILTMVKKGVYIRYIVLTVFCLLLSNKYITSDNSADVLNTINITNRTQGYPTSICPKHFTEQLPVNIVEQCHLRPLLRLCYKLFWNAVEFQQFTTDISNAPVQADGYIINETFSQCRQFVALEVPAGSRLGNQMFMTAALIGIAYENDLIPIIKPTSKLLKYFNLPNVAGLHLKDVSICAPALPGVYEKCAKSRSNMSLHGYFQSWKYFKNIPDVVRRMFSFKDKYRKLAKSFLNTHSKQNYTNICLHVRRGDMMWSYHQKRGMATADLDFIYKSIHYYKTVYANSVFFIVSDDMKWCRANIQENVIFSIFSNAGYDLALLTFCDHVVVTSGTFGWWGAWLSEGKTVYFKGFPRSGSRQAARIKRTDYYPTEWIGL